jgi:hypothetical protein
MTKLTQEQLTDFMVTVWEGGSNYWFELSEKEVEMIISSTNGGVFQSFAERLAEALWDGNSITVVDAEDPDEVLGELTLEKINKAMNMAECSDEVECFLDESYDIWTTDNIIQFAMFGEIVYG